MVCIPYTNHIDSNQFIFIRSIHHFLFVRPSHISQLPPQKMEPHIFANIRSFWKYSFCDAIVTDSQPTHANACPHNYKHKSVAVSQLVSIHIRFSYNLHFMMSFVKVYATVVVCGRYGHWTFSKAGWEGLRKGGNGVGICVCLLYSNMP